MSLVTQVAQLWHALSAVEGVLSLAVFGSRVNPDEHVSSTSDLDVLLIVETGKLKDFDFLTQVSEPLREAGEHLGTEIDLCLYEKEDLLKRLADRDPFLESVLAQARFVQGQPLPPHPDPEPSAEVRGRLTEQIRPLGRAVSPKLCQNYWNLATQSLRDAAFPDLSPLGKLSATTMTLQALAGLVLELTGRRSRRSLSHVDRILAAFEVLGLSPEMTLPLKDILTLQQKVELFEVFDATEEQAKSVVGLTAKCYQHVKAWLLETYPEFAVEASKPGKN